MVAVLAETAVAHVEVGLLTRLCIIDDGAGVEGTSADMYIQAEFVLYACETFLVFLCANGRCEHGFCKLTARGKCIGFFVSVHLG